jgi:hypothetical protein
MNSAGLGPGSDCELYERITDPSSRQEGHPTWPQLSDSNKNLVMGGGGSTPRRTDRLTVGRKITWTWTCYHVPLYIPCESLRWRQRLAGADAFACESDKISASLNVEWLAHFLCIRDSAVQISVRRLSDTLSFNSTSRVKSQLISQVKALSLLPHLLIIIQCSSYYTVMPQSMNWVSAITVKCTEIRWINKYIFRLVNNETARLE